ncbi:MAG: hypothetical protein ACKOS8_04040, partial [Gemmataceae bacterium]
MLHYYEFVLASGITWDDANTAALARTYDGLQGYLATITSTQENTFAFSKVSGYGWIGASDDYRYINNALNSTTFANQAASEGKWYWVTGPEAGQQFWQGTSSGASVGGRYNNWGSGEPNNAGNENFGHFLNNGQWNDFAYNNGSIAGYLVEYGGFAGNPSSGGGSSGVVAAQGSFTITLVNDTPSLGGTSSAAYTENGVPLSIAPSGTVSDPDLPASFNGGFLQAEISTNGTSPDQLTIINTAGGITTTGSTTSGGATVYHNGVAIGTIDAALYGANNTVLRIDLNASATTTATQTLLRAIAFSNTSDNPSNLARTVTFTLNDGMNTSTLAGDTARQTTATATVNFTSVNDAPTFAATVSGTWTEGDSVPLQFLSGATVGDPDTSHFNGGSFTVAFGAYVAGDVLSVVGGGNGITVTGSTVSYNGNTIGTISGGSAANLVVTFTSANATFAAVQALIAQIGYTSTSQNPTWAGANPVRAVTLTLNDGGNTASASTPLTATQSGTINVIGINDAPTLTNLNALAANTHIQG